MIGNLCAAGFGEVVSGVTGDGRIERRGFQEIGDQFGDAARVHDRAGKLVRAEFASFLEHVDIFGGERGSLARGGVLLNQVGEVQRAGEASGACADDEDVGFELFAFDWHAFILSEPRVKRACELRRQGAAYRLLENYMSLILGGLEEDLIAEP